MNITQYRNENQSVKPNAGIQQRWAERVVGNGYHVKGRAGAENYLARYGKGIGADKCVAMARMAEASDALEFAARMWEEAFFLAQGRRETLPPADGSLVTTAVVSRPAAGMAERFGQLPQLLTPVTREEALALASDPRYGVQEKIDGERFLSRTFHGVSTGGNKRGFVRWISDRVAEALVQRGDSELDGEAVDATLHVFDALSLGGRDLRRLPFGQRHAELVEWFNAGAGEMSAVRLVPLVSGSAEAKLNFIEALEARGAEGFVLKQLDAPYQEGDDHGTQVKYQFRGRAAVIAGERNGTKNSVEVFVRRASDGELRNMGSVTVPANVPFPEKGQVIEVEFLYVHPGASGCFAQPVFKGLRTDVVPADCTDGKLRVKGAAAA